jgi:hypothetical protein
MPPWENAEVRDAQSNASLYAPRLLQLLINLIAGDPANPFTDEGEVNSDISGEMQRR